MNDMPDDDLFNDSTMTFGEHLEELRRALFRACAGLVVGLLVAVFVADDVVRWIEEPLREGLRGFYLKKAKHELANAGEALTSLEDWAILEQLEWSPQVVRVNRAQLRQAIGGSALADESPTWTPEPLSAEDASAICQRWQQAAADSVEGLIWSLLTDEERARCQSDTSQQPARFTEIVNRLCTSSALYERIYERLLPRCKDPDQKAILQQTYARLQKSPSTTDTRAINRQLLQLAVPELQFRPEAMVQLVTWSPMNVQVQALSVHEPFLIYLKAALVVALILASPWIFLQIWEFVAAGLYPHERKLVYTFLPFSIGLFLLGASLAFFFVFDPVLDFLFQWNLNLDVSAEPRITDWISFVLLLPLGFGVSFQLPLVMLFMERIGMFTVESYLSQWRIAVLSIFVLSMFLTPADPVSMILMAIPLTILFFGGVLLCKYFPRELQPQKP